jgi:hypothetical protein
LWGCWSASNCVPGGRWRTIEAGSEQASVQIVSVWAQGERLCLAQSKVAENTNEITAIPDLLRPLERGLW